MTLKAADAFFASRELDETPEVPDDVPRHGNLNDGRPRIRHADDPTKLSFFWRASSFGKQMEDHFLIHRSDKRKIVWAVARYESLQMESQAVEYLDVPDDADERTAKRVAACKRELERIAEDAIKAAGGRDASTKGTSFHKLRERRDNGEDLAFVGPKTYAALDAWSRMADRFTWHGSEQFVVNDRWQAAGTYDALWSPRGTMTAPDGARITPEDRLIVDLKSGAWTIDNKKITYGAQLAVYANGRPYRHVTDEEAAAGINGRYDWPDGIAPRTDWALIPHVPIASPEDAGLIWVNLRRGYALGEAAVLIKAAQRVDDLFYPAELPALSPSARTEHELMQLIRDARTGEECDALWQHNQQLWTAAHTVKVIAKLTEIEEET